MSTIEIEGRWRNGLGIKEGFVKELRCLHWKRHFSDEQSAGSDFIYIYKKILWSTRGFSDPLYYTKSLRHHPLVVS